MVLEVVAKYRLNILLTRDEKARLCSSNDKVIISTACLKTELWCYKSNVRARLPRVFFFSGSNCRYITILQRIESSIETPFFNLALFGKPKCKTGLFQNLFDIIQNFKSHVNGKLFRITDLYYNL